MPHTNQCVHVLAVWAKENVFDGQTLARGNIFTTVVTVTFFFFFYSASRATITFSAGFNVREHYKTY